MPVTLARACVVLRDASSVILDTNFSRNTAYEVTRHWVEELAAEDFGQRESFCTGWWDSLATLLARWMYIAQGGAIHSHTADLLPNLFLYMRGCRFSQNIAAFTGGGIFT